MKRLALFFTLVFLVLSANIERALVVSQVFTGGDVQNISYVIHRGKKIAFVARLSEGFVLMPVSELLPPIKLYSKVNRFDPENPIIKAVLEEIYFKEELLSHKPFIKDLLDPKGGVLQWRRLETGYLKGEVAAPLVKTKWDQGYPYNYYTPVVGGKRTWAGCVATAFAQIMKYWNWPDVGTGSHSYTWNGTILSANFNHVYYWNRMPLQLFTTSSFSEIDAVARLLSDVGIAFEMDYGVDGSAAYPSLALKAFPGYFKYSKGIIYKKRGEYGSGKKWFLRMKWERDMKRPFEFTICGTDVCHAVVVDGYKITGDSYLIHINFGWSGHFDGYYGIDNINAGSYNFSDPNSQDAVFNIFPRGMLFPPDSVTVTRHIDRGLFVHSYIDEVKMSKSPSVENSIVAYRIYVKKNGQIEKIWEGEYSPVVRIRSFDENVSYGVSVVDSTGRESEISPFVSPESE